MDTNPDTQELAQSLLEVMPRIYRFMITQMTDITGNDTTMLQTGSLHILMHNRMTTSDLAKKRHISLQAASTFVQGMVERGWVVRLEDPQDRRRFILEVTEEGKRQNIILQKQINEHLASQLADLSPQEIEAGKLFLSSLKRLMQNTTTIEGC
ncbi:hypothetical protein MASR2M15_12690 [Anaerolineales bacterium]